MGPWGVASSVSDCLLVFLVVPFACAANVAAELFGSRPRWADLDMDEVQTQLSHVGELNIHFVFMWSLRLLRFAVMLGMDTSWIVRSMLWAVFG